MRVASLLIVLAPLGIGACSSIWGLPDVPAAPDGGSDGGIFGDGTIGDAPQDTGSALDSSVAAEAGPDAGAAEASACLSGVTCAPSGCVLGSTVCDDAGQVLCGSPVNQPNGAACDAGAVCSGGSCVACAAGSDCSEAGSCQSMTLACSTGSPVCTSHGNKTDGTPCGGGQYCENGACLPCTNGAACPPSANPCHQGALSCGDGGGITCTDTGQNAADGTSCGTNDVCFQGGCVACTAGTSCNPGANPCQTGTTSCASGQQTCSSPRNVTDGTPCGTNMVCGAGQCVACTAGASCNPGGDVCQTGTIACGTGSPVCANTTNAADGTSCGANQVCFHGTCGPCTVGAACSPGGNACQTGTTSCVTGQPVCNGTGDVADGTACGSGGACCSGTCVNESGDAANCGRCGHGCQGGSCASGKCLPVTLESPQVNPIGLAVDSTSIYWTNVGNNSTGRTVSKAHLDGTAPVVLNNTVNAQPDSVAVDSTSVYWSNDIEIGGAILKVPLAGGTPTTVTTSSNPREVVVDATNVYWVAGSNGYNQVLQQPLAGGAATTLATTFVQTQMAVDSTNVYFTTGTACCAQGTSACCGMASLEKVPIGGGTTTKLAAASYPTSVTFDSSLVYWADGVLEKVPIAGGSVSTVSPSASAVAVDAALVYWTTGTAVMAQAKTGGTPITLATGPGVVQLGRIVLDATSVYWVQTGDLSQLHRWGHHEGREAVSAQSRWLFLLLPVTMASCASIEGVVDVPVPDEGGALDGSSDGTVGEASDGPESFGLERRW